MDIQEAVKQAKAGKEEGYDYLYQQTYQKSYYVALKYMKQEDAALDVLQDSYIKAFQNLEQLQDAEKFSAWFSKVVATKALDELKKKKVVLFSQMELETGDSSVESLFLDDRIDTQPELSLDKAETSRLVQEMIDTLSDEQRICVTMYYVEEMTVKEMAETLGVSENTVKSRLNYARKNIKEKVLELEKKGTKLYGLAPIPFFLYLLLSDSINVQAAELPVNHILDNAAKEAIKAQQGAGKLAQIGGKGMELLTKKIIIGIVSAVVVIGGTIAGIMAYNSHQDKIAEEAMAIEMEKAAEEAAMQTEELMNDKELLEQMSKETVTEKSEETATQPVEPKNEVDSTEPQVTEPVAAAPPQFTYTDLEQVMYAKSSVNVRDLPDTVGNKLGGLATSQSVKVTGQCNETGWYRIDYNGTVAYVSDKYIVADKPVVEVALKPVEQPAPEQPAQQPETPTEQPVQEQPAANSFPYELMTIIQFDEHTVGYYYCGDAGLNPTSDLGSLLQQACTDLYASKYSNYSGYYRDYFKIGTYDIGEVWALKAWYTAYN